jgi:hypothetical protein
MAVLLSATVVLASAVVLLLLRTDHLTKTELTKGLPTLPPPPPVSVSYTATMPTMWHVEHCFPPADISLHFKAAGTEIQLFKHNPRISFRINRQGIVDQAQLLQSSGSPTLDHRILRWLGESRFATQVKGCELSWKGDGFINVEF